MLVKYIMVPGEFEYDFFTFKSSTSKVQTELMTKIEEITTRAKNQLAKDEADLKKKFKKEEKLNDESKFFG